MNIYESMAAVMEDCGAVAKSSTNEKKRYKYRGIDAVMNALNPAMVRNGIFVAPEVLEHHQKERTSRNGEHVRGINPYTFAERSHRCI